MMLRNAGIGLTASGAALVGVGVGLAVAEERVADGDEERSSVRELRPAGVAIAIVGGAVLAGGVVALALHGARAKRSKRTAWTPAAGRGFVGLVIERRF